MPAPDQYRAPPRGRPMTAEETAEWADLYRASAGITVSDEAKREKLDEKTIEVICRHVIHVERRRVETAGKKLTSIACARCGAPLPVATVIGPHVRIANEFFHPRCVNIIEPRSSHDQHQTSGAWDD